MAVYTFQALDQTGATVSGELDVVSKEKATDYLTSKGYIPLSVSAGRTASAVNFWANLNDRFKGVKPKDLILFTKQFRSMLHAGIPIVRLLNILEMQTENTVLKKAIASISTDIRSGSTLANAMEKYPHIFSSLYRSMVGAGEVSGSLTEVLERLIYITEHEAKIKSDIRSALQYPIIVLIALGMAFFILLTFVIPKFVTIFLRANIELPLPTRMAMGLYQFLNSYGHFVVLGLIGFIFAFRYYVKTEEGRFQKDALLLRLPVFGPLFIKAAMSRFASIFAILSASGIPVMKTVSIISGVIGNSAIGRAFDGVRDRMEKGEGISEPLRGATYFPPMVIDMISIGEESGNLDEMLREISHHYDDEVAYAVRGLSDALGPFLIIGLAAVVGFFALAIFMPMWDLTKMVK